MAMEAFQWPLVLRPVVISGNNSVRVGSEMMTYYMPSIVSLDDRNNKFPSVLLPIDVWLP